MDVLLAILIIVCLILIFVGMVKPNVVLFWSKKITRGRVIALYGLLLLLFLILFSLINYEPEKDRLSDNMVHNYKSLFTDYFFEGTLTYELSIEDSIPGSNPKKIKLFILENGFRMQLRHPENAAFIFDNENKRGYIIKDSLKTILELAVVQTDMTNLNNATIIQTYDTRKINGFHCRKYLIQPKAETKKFDSMHCWLSREINLPVYHYDFTDIDVQIPVPVPITMKLKPGTTIISMEVFNGNVKQKHEVLEVNETKLSKELLAIPEEYDKIETGNL